MSEFACDKIPKDITAIGTRRAAEILGCSQRHIRKLIYDGRIRHWLLSPRASVVCEKEVKAYAKEVAKKRADGDLRGSLPKGFKPDLPPAR